MIEYEGIDYFTPTEISELIGVSQNTVIKIAGKYNIGFRITIKGISRYLLTLDNADEVKLLVGNKLGKANGRYRETYGKVEHYNFIDCVGYAKQEDVFARVVPRGRIS